MKQAEIYIDGAAKGNPGPAGIGVVICRDGQVIKNLHQYIGNATNNVAEYSALIFALQEALILKIENLVVNTDSELLFRQIKKEYKVKSPHLLGLYNQALHLLSSFKSVNIKHIPRENNLGADKLANIAVKEARKKA
ncbi:MAG: ribonuclease HI family protein [Candidatus Omnitrophica bacterium]|nr:ribonuclease HI family protein [Candidatus Omnitrophota bacterium]